MTEISSAYSSISSRTNYINENFDEDTDTIKLTTTSITTKTITNNGSMVNRTLIILSMTSSQNLISTLLRKK